MMHNLNPSMSFQGNGNSESESKNEISNTKKSSGKKINKINKTFKEDR